MISAGKNGPLQETAKDHKREAARLRALAKSATTSPMKARLLEQARQHDALAGTDAEEPSGSAAPLPA